MKVVTRVMLGFVAILLCCVSACQFHYYKARRTPAVSGKVVDIETGQPIAGADVMVVIHGFPSDPAAAVASSGVFIAGGDLKTDSEGKFLFASQTPRIKDSGTTLMSYIFWGPEKQIGIEVNVFSKEHITAASKTEGLDWKEDPFFESGYEGKNGDRFVRVSRKKQLKGEYQYLIETKKAVTEKEWQLKCHDTLLSCHDPEQKGDEWLFNDLVGYLERFPDGEKAGEYLNKAISISLARYERKDSPSNEDRYNFSTEAQYLLGLAEKVQEPKAPLGLKIGYEMDINELRRELSKAKQFMNKE